MVALSEKVREILDLFRADNVVELLTKSDKPLMTNIGELFSLMPELDMAKQKHQPINKFIKPKSTTASLSLDKVIDKLHRMGFVEHFSVTDNQFLNCDSDSLRLCCDGTRQFNDTWVSFRCLRESRVVFAFRNVQDAVLFRMHI
jgi:hypothetical protein